MKGWWSSLTTSLAGLRRLSQPYFLPLQAGAGSFLLLLAALVAVVVGLSLLLFDFSKSRISLFLSQCTVDLANVLVQS